MGTRGEAPTTTSLHDNTHRAPRPQPKGTSSETDPADPNLAGAVEKGKELPDVQRTGFLPRAPAEMPEEKRAKVQRAKQEHGWALDAQAWTTTEHGLETEEDSSVPQTGWGMVS